jgi:hypothetical protein
MVPQQLPAPYGYGPGYGAPSQLGPPPGFGYGQPAPPPPQQTWNPMHGGSFDTSSLASNFSTMSLTPPGSNDWYVDSGAGAHMVNNAGIISSSQPPSSSNPSSIIVGNGAILPVTSVGSHSFFTPRRPLILSNVVISPSIIKNLISVRRFTTDNNCSIEFDPFGLSVKDLQTRSVIARCNSMGDLYPFFSPTPTSTTALTVAASSATLWHRRLGHIDHEALSKLISSHAISCNKRDDTHICHACQLGRHVRLPFSVSNSCASLPFDLIYCDLWTSPVVSVSGYKYYLVILDDCTHFCWTFPLWLKSDTFTTLTNFFSYVRTQFGSSIKAVQCDNGREFDHSSARTFFLTYGVVLRLSCPYTSQQNGWAERILRTINNIVRSLMFHASLPPVYWADCLHTATYLRNRHPTKTLDGRTPYLDLHGAQPSYTHLRVFGCACYPNLSSTTPHKLSPRSSLCVFPGYSSDHKGYQCLDLHYNRILIFRHVVFDEAVFPFADMSTSPQAPTTLDFLTSTDDSSLPYGSRAVYAGSRSLGIMDAAPGRPGNSGGAPTSSLPLDGDLAAPSSVPATVAPDGAPTIGSVDSAAPADTSSQVVASGVGRPSGRTTATVPQAIHPVTKAHGMRTHGKEGTQHPVDRLNLQVAVLSPVPSSIRSGYAGGV